jgi:lysozyme family protein
VTASERPDDAQQLREEIERTREHLGETVEQLAAKADVKGRARAEAAGLADQVTRRAKDVMARARKQIADRAGSARGTLAATTADARQKAAAAGEAAPGPGRLAAAQGAGAARKHRGPLSAAVAAVLLAVLGFLIWRRGKR